MEADNTPATKQDIATLRSGMQQDIAMLRSETKQDIAMLRSEMQHMHDELKESMRDNQTELLKAFYGFAQNTDVKMKDAEVSDILLRQRLTAVESRLTEIERRLNLPPAA